VAEVKRARLSAPREILVVLILIIIVLRLLVVFSRLSGGLSATGSRLGSGGVSGGSGGGDGGTGQRAGRGRGNLNLAGNAENLADVDVAALSVNLRVVGVENGGVQSVVACDAFAGVTRDHSVGGRAILSSISEAKLAAGNKVGAFLVDNASVNGGELVGRDVPSSRNAVADIASLDGVLPCAIFGEDLGKEGKRDKGGGENHFDNVKDVKECLVKNDWNVKRW